MLNRRELFGAVAALSIPTLPVVAANETTVLGGSWNMPSAVGYLSMFEDEKATVPIVSANELLSNLSVNYKQNVKSFTKGGVRYYEGEEVCGELSMDSFLLIPESMKHPIFARTKTFVMDVHNLNIATNKSWHTLRPLTLVALKRISKIGSYFKLEQPRFIFSHITHHNANGNEST